MARYVQIEPYFKLSEKNRFGAFLINSLRHKKMLFIYDTKAVLAGDILQVGVNEKFDLLYGINISEKHQYRFNNFLFDEYCDRMLDFVTARMTGKKGDVKQALLCFRHFYGITEDDLPYKTLVKQWERKYYPVTACKSA